LKTERRSRVRAAKGDDALDAQDLIIRPAEWRDEPALVEMQRLALRTLGAGYYEPEAIESFIANVGTMDRTMLDDRSYFVAEAGDAIVGCGGWSRRAPSYAALESDPNAAAPSWPLIRAVYVHPNCVRQGIGRRIMHAVESDMAQAGIARVALIATLMGVPLYRHIGYRTMHPVMLVFPDGNRFIGIAMEKSLARPERLAA
jgi:GNAT superfamily N-acetyltransferase